jgi:hypothetical protein
MKNKISSRPWLLLALATVIYAYLTYISPRDTSARYGLTDAEITLLQLTIIIPILIIWVAAVYGWQRIDRYVSRIEASPDGAALVNIRKGLAWLIIGFIGGTLVSSARSLMPKDPSHLMSVTVISKLASAIIPLVGFYFLFQGGLALRALVNGKKRHGGLNALRVVALGLTSIAAVVFIIALFLNPYRQAAPPTPNGLPLYYLSDPFILLFIVFPTIVTWLFVVEAVIEISYYQRHIKGRIYRRALGWITAGLVMIILTCVILNALTTIDPTVFLGLSVKAILLIVYALVVLIGSGYILISIGAQRLHRIETLT